MARKEWCDEGRGAGRAWDAQRIPAGCMVQDLQVQLWAVHPTWLHLHGEAKLDQLPVLRRIHGTGSERQPQQPRRRAVAPPHAASCVGLCTAGAAGEAD